MSWRLEPPPGAPLFMALVAVAALSYVWVSVRVFAGAVLSSRTLIVCFALALAARVPMLGSPDTSAHDAVRYIWDARVGAVTKPWEANVTFRSLPADTFRAFDEPDYVKIAWTLRADARGAASSIFRTETRAVATDPRARMKFRRYWAFLSPGILLIRRMMLAPLKAEAERRAAERVSGAA